MEDFAQGIANLFAPGDIILLSGPIGAGKSIFARAFIRSRLGESGLHEDIPSPTFTLVQTYEGNGLEIWHVDLFRLESIDEVAELGLDHAFESALCLIEWPEILGSLAPPDAISLSFSISGDNDSRRILKFSRI